MLEVFAEQGVATRLKRGGDDQCVVDAEAMVAGEADGGGVDFNCKQNYFRKS